MVEIAPFDERAGHSRVARITDPPVSAEGAKLSDEVVISIGGILAILLGIFDQEVDRLILVLGIVEPADRAAIGSYVAEKSLPVLCCPVGVGRPDRPSWIFWE